ncbi:MAG: hypothetical protein KBB11_01720 [Bacteroidales bacterium]|nr:hypothetical protein [Bacteroidales bacterium]HOY38207.1 hypothetical protein [Bacteroidales bacterium]HQP03010.1 hypothetical protein [Bacteroidales bacterium]
MRNAYPIAAAFLIILISVSCASSRLTKKGSKMEEAGMYVDAAEYYYQAVLAKKSNVDAKLGLKRTGQRVLDKKLSAFNKSYNEEKNQEAVYNFKDAEDYYNKITAVGVELNFPSYYRENYDEVKNVYIADKYNEASKLLENEKFAEAEKLFREILQLQPGYKDSKEKLNVAIYEPVYRDAQQKMNNKMYRAAYYLFDKVISGSGNYKDAYELKAECLEKATLMLAVSPVVNKSGTAGIETSLQAAIIKDIQDKRNPFLKLVEANPRLQPDGSLSKGQQPPVKAVNPDITLYTTVTGFTYEKGMLKETEKRGYRKYTKQTKDEAGNVRTVTDYEKVTYKEYSMGRQVKISFTYKLIYNKTGEIIATNSHTLVSEDKILYADYTGDKKALVPGYWKNKAGHSSEDVVNDNQKDVKALQELLDGRRVIKDYNTLTGEVISASSMKVADAVNEYNPEE